MTMQGLRQLLETAVADVYDVAPPQGSPRHVVLNPAAPLTFAADNTVYYSVPRCRAQLQWTSPGDTLLSDVTSALRSSGVPYSLDFDDYDFDDALFGASMIISLLEG